MSDQKFKADAGKEKPDLLQVGFARALRLVQATMEYGSIKYEEHSWRHVPNAMDRYFRAGERHRQKRLLADYGDNHDSLENVDHESGLPHIAHEVFNLLAQIELDLEGYDEPLLELERMVRFKQPPTGHKE